MPDASETDAGALVGTSEVCATTLATMTKSTKISDCSHGGPLPEPERILPSRR